MKTAVSIPDELFKQAEELAGALKTSRSGLYARALSEFIARHSPERITDRMNEALDEVGVLDSEFAEAAAHQTLRDSEW